MGTHTRDVNIRRIDADAWDWIVGEATARGVRVAEVIEEMVETCRRVQRGTEGA